MTEFTFQWSSWPYPLHAVYSEVTTLFHAKRTVQTFRSRQERTMLDCGDSGIRLGFPIDTLLAAARFVTYKDAICGWRPLLACPSEWSCDHWTSGWSKVAPCLQALAPDTSANTKNRLTQQDWAQRAQTSANAKISTKSDRGFQSRLPD